jgi:hypothetical protein
MFEKTTFGSVIPAGRRRWSGKRRLEEYLFNLPVSIPETAVNVIVAIFRLRPMEM